MDHANGTEAGDGGTEVPGTRPPSIVTRVYRKARQGPGPLAAAVARALLRRTPRPVRDRYTLFKAWARNRRRSVPDGLHLRAPCVPGLVSVILPVYNQAEYLADSIESVLRQTYSNFELIVINDGSRDDVETVLARYAGTARVRILTQANQKLPKALSNGFEFARGEFWTWTSADNLMHPEQLGRLVSYLREHPQAGMVYADYLAIDDRGALLTDPSFRPQNRSEPTSPEIHLPRITLELSAGQDNFIGPCFMYRGWIGRLLGEYDPNLGLEDYDYWMRLDAAFRIEHLGTDETLYRYRVHDNSLSARAAELRILERCLRLMDYEQQRAAYYREPWTIVSDGRLSPRFRFRTPDPHRHVTWQEREAVPLGTAGKWLYLCSGRSLETLGAAGRQAGRVVVAWFDSIDDVYEHRIAARRFAKAAFVPTVAIAQRLELIGVPAFVVADGSSLFELAVRFANNRTFYEATRPEELRERTLPVPFRAPRRCRRILFQVDHFEQGGLENVVHHLATGLDPVRFDVSLLVLGRSGAAAERARRAGLRVLSLRADQRASRYRELLAENRIDLVDAHYSVFGAEIAAERGIPFVQVVHNSYVWLGDEEVSAYRKADGATTAYACVSAEVARYCDQRMGLSVSRMLVIPNGIDTQQLEADQRVPPESLRRELGLGTDDFVFLNVASIHGTKAQTVLVRAMAEVVRARPNARLVLLGAAMDAGYVQRLRSLVASLGLERHLILGGHRGDVARFYWMADTFVLPSYWEGWSLALSEAVCTGLPIITSEVGGARELVAQAGGTLLKPPFRSISDLDPATIGALVSQDDPRYASAIARAMIDACDARHRKLVAAPLKESLLLERMIQRHSLLFDWLIQGGEPAAARSWMATSAAPRLAGLDPLKSDSAAA